MDALKVAVSKGPDLETLVSLGLLHLGGMKLEVEVVQSTRGLGADVAPFIVTDTSKKPLVYVEELLAGLGKQIPVSAAGFGKIRELVGQERGNRRFSLASLAITTVLKRRLAPYVQHGDRREAVGLVEEAVGAFEVMIQAVDSRAQGEEPKTQIHASSIGPQLLEKQSKLLERVGGSPDVLFGTLMQLILDCFHLGYGPEFIQEFTRPWFDQCDALFALDHRASEKDRAVETPDVVLVKFYGYDLPADVRRESDEAHARRQAAIAEVDAMRPQVAPVRKGVVDTGTCVLRVEAEQVRGRPAEQRGRMGLGRRTEEPVYQEVVSVRRLIEDLKAAGYRATYAYGYTQPKGDHRPVLVIRYAREGAPTKDELAVLQRPVVRAAKDYNFAGCAVWVNRGQKDGVVATVNMDVPGRGEGAPTKLRFNPEQGRECGFYLESEEEPGE